MLTLAAYDDDGDGEYRNREELEGGCIGTLDAIAT